MTVRSAVSIRQPYAFAICFLGKRLENRGRDDGKVPVLCRHRGPILLHASSWFGLEKVRDQARDCIEVARENGLNVDQFAPINLRRLKSRTGGIVGRCHVIGSVKDGPHLGRVPTAERSFPPGFVGSVADLMEEEQRWFCGPHAAVLALVEPFREIIPCKGSLGIFQVPPDVAAAADLGEVWRPGRDWCE